MKESIHRFISSKFLKKWITRKKVINYFERNLHINMSQKICAVVKKTGPENGKSSGFAQ